MSVIADAWGAWSDALDVLDTDVRSLFSDIDPAASGNEYGHTPRRALQSGGIAGTAKNKRADWARFSQNGVQMHGLARTTSSLQNYSLQLHRS